MISYYREELLQIEPELSANALGGLHIPGIEEKKHIYFDFNSYSYYFSSNLLFNFMFVY